MKPMIFAAALAVLATPAISQENWINRDCNEYGAFAVPSITPGSLSPIILEKLRKKDAPKIEAARQECERRKQQQIEGKAAREAAERQVKIEAARQEALRKGAEQKAKMHAIEEAQRAEPDAPTPAEPPAATVGGLKADYIIAKEAIGCANLDEGALSTGKATGRIFDLSDPDHCRGISVGTAVLLQKRFRNAVCVVPEGASPPCVWVLNDELKPAQAMPSESSSPTPGRAVLPNSSLDEVGDFVKRVLGSTELVWKEIFSHNGENYRPTTLVLYRDSTASGCGQALSSMGPFYCPVDQKIYLDSSFITKFETRFPGCVGKPCMFARAFVIARLVSNHVQNLLGILPRAQQAQKSAQSTAVTNRIQLQFELQADCLAGVWARHQTDLDKSRGLPFTDQSAFEADLKLVAQGQGNAPNSFDQSNPEQRLNWALTGFTQGSVVSCNTFAATNL